ncbi:MAG: DUF808 domain-containing protein, partial [Tateyamaria sp.]
VHGLAQMGWHGPEDIVYGIAKSVGGTSAAAVWGVKAVLHGLLGLAWGFVLIPVGEKIITPVWRTLAPKAV